MTVDIERVVMDYVLPEMPSPTVCGWTWTDLAFLPDYPAHEGNGYIYVVDFGSKLLKVGRTRRPRQRMATHRDIAMPFDFDIKRVWLSVPHSQWCVNERRLIDAAEVLARECRGTEYFADCPFDELVKQASKFDYQEVK